MSCYNSRASLRPANAGCKPIVIQTIQKPVSTPGTGGTIAAPTLTLVQISPTQINITWTSVTGATRYQLERATLADFSDSIVVYNGTLTSFNDIDLPQGIKYYYRITPLNSNVSTGSLPPVGSVSGLPYILPFILS